MKKQDHKITSCASFNLRKTSRVVAQFYDQCLIPSGLKSTQFTLLASLAHLGTSSVNELAAALGMDRTTLTRNIRLLEKDKLIQGEAGADARLHLLSVTTKGNASLNNALPHWAQAQKKLVSQFGEKRWRHLQQELTAVALLAKNAKL